MKQLFLILLICLFTQSVFAQNDDMTTYNPPAMTSEFADSLKSQISRIIPKHYSIKLLYRGELTAEGKFPTPRIAREEADGTIEDNTIVTKLRLLIMAAPAWKPAYFGSSGKQTSSIGLFFVVIDNGKIDVRMDTKGIGKF